ncbi:putative membrane protein [Lachnospiraceae bacterium KM106-2]|nr:putative membrane protein [Lachnospiraceae bacterium KM106-2]
MNRLKRWGEEWLALLKLNIKLLLSNRPAIVLFVVLSVLFIVLSSGLSNEAEKRSSIPVGILDRDKTGLSERFLKGLKTSEALYLIPGSDTELEKMLEDEKIKAYFVIERGYEKKIEKGQTNGVVSMYYLKENSAVSILTDLAAKYMISDIAFYKSYLMYQSLGTDYEIQTKKQYATRLDQIESDDNFKFSIETKIENRKGMEQHEEVKNDLLYRQVIIGMLAVFLAFLIMFLIFGVRKEKMVTRRLILTGISPSIDHIGTISSVLLCLSPAFLVISILLSNVIQKSGLVAYIEIFIMLLLFSWVSAELFYLLSQMCEKVIAYQFIGSLLLLGIGGVSLLTILANLISGEILKIAKITPNYWFIKRFTDIIVKRNGFDLWGVPNTMLVVIGVVFIILGKGMMYIGQKIQQ